MDGSEMDGAEEGILENHRLCGFLMVGLSCSTKPCGGGVEKGTPISREMAAELESTGCPGETCPDCAKLIGARCTLAGQGSEVHVCVDRSGLRLFPISADKSQNSGHLLQGISSADRIGDVETALVDETSKGIKHIAAGGASSGKRKRAGAGNVHAPGGSVLQQLQWLRTKNRAIVRGRILVVAHRNSTVRLAALLDVYIPSSVWIGAGFWKSGPIAAAALTHSSCDWEKRKGVLNLLKTGGKRVGAESLWELGNCDVLDCKMHHGSPDLAQARFDLHSLFKSLPSCKTEAKPVGLKIEPNDKNIALQAGIWDVPDEMVTSIFRRLLPKDLHNVAAVCRYACLMAVSIMPCMNLRLFPHQQAAVSWMLQRENKPGVLAHPLYKKMETEDGFPFYLDMVSGELSPETPAEVHDFRGGLFCDEPGLGKTVTALSLILKTQGASADPPPGTQVFWVPQGSGERAGYYEVSASATFSGGSVLKRSMLLNAQKSQEGPWESCSRQLSGFNGVATSKTSGDGLVKGRNVSFGESSTPDHTFSVSRSTRLSGRTTAGMTPLAASPNFGSTRSSVRVKRKLSDAFKESLGNRNDGEDGNGVGKRTARAHRILNITSGEISTALAGRLVPASASAINHEGDNSHVGEEIKSQEETSKWIYEEEVWVQCEACSKWRKLPLGVSAPKDEIAWFCSMNPDSFYQKCTIPEQLFGYGSSVKSLPGFYKNGSAPGQQQNVAFFASVLKENVHLYDEFAKRPVMWLANLNQEKLGKLATVGVSIPREYRGDGLGVENRNCEALLRLFGLVQRKVKRGAAKWHYPKGLDNLIFDSLALKEAARKPRDDATRLYVSKATLIVVPQNLVEHWKNQIAKHTTRGQLRVYVWTDHKKPPAPHTLAWEYDIVITTFHCLSTEWSTRENTVLMRVHWLRVMLDEGHTLGASLSLTNKLQMAISMHASRRWLLTGTPTPNTPNSQVAHLQPLLKFLHEDIYGKQQKVWENSVLRPFEAGREEGRSRLIQLLHRVMISSRKADLCTIPPCIRKVKLLDFTEKHAASYNELVVTVQRNILLADWRDPSHVESLLNPKQWKFRGTTLRNTRLSCCVAGHIKVGMCGEDVQEAMDLLVEEKGIDPTSDLYTNIQTALTYGGKCDRCREWCRLPIVTPCCHMLCITCVALDCEKCTLPGCGNAYKMQSPAESARPENPTPKWPVPQDLIELQPSYAQYDWDPDWHATSSSKVAYLVEQLKMLQVRNILQHSLKTGCHIEAEARNFGIDSWQTYTINSQNASLPEKAIVFSQFLEHINVIEEQLSAASIRHVGLYSPMHQVHKLKSLLTFQNDPGCTVLVMDGSAALGLDLSFVTHVYLMEPIWDGSMEEQVVSRAHRMGATRPVRVETLAMRGTIEQQMLESLQDPSEGGRGRLRDGHDNSSRGNHRSTNDPVESGYLVHMDFVRTG